jgi:AcrR family transcriptional regulator
MVEAIVESAARVFDMRGYEGATTNEVAEVAGVGIGSLYQYFPNKDALLTALHERHVQHMLELVEAAFDATRHAPWDASLRALVGAVMRAHSARPNLQRILHVEQRALEHPAAASTAKQRLLARTRDLLARHRAALDVDDVELASHVVLRQVEALVHAAVLDPVPDVTPSAMEDAIVDAVQGYLRPPHR